MKTKSIKVSIAIIINKEKEIIISKRSKDKTFGGKWEFVGGKIENNESPTQAIIREIKEEVKIKKINSIKKILKFKYDYKEGEKIVFYIFKVEINESVESKINQKIKKVTFNTIEKINMPKANYRIIKKIKKNMLKQLI